MTRRVQLTPAQQRRYEQLFAIAASEPDTTDSSADEQAWQGLIEEWPELANYEGASN
jgi:hypothetical protein